MRVSNKLKEKIIKFFDNLFHDKRTKEENKYMEQLTYFDGWLVNNGYLKDISTKNKMNIVPTKKLLFLNFNDCNNLISSFIANFSNYENNPTFDIFRERFKFYYNKLRDNFGKILQEENQIFICLYCQRNYIGIFENEDANKGYTVPDLDHFYPKSKYPFLAATISNLIPACCICNQRIKQDKDTYKRNIIPILEENVFEKIEFNHYHTYPYINNYTKLDRKYKRYIEFFKIQEQYSLHSEIITEIQVKMNKYNRIKKKHLCECCPSLTEIKIEDLAFHEYKYVNKNKTPLWKLKQDIYEKMKKNETI